MYEFGSYGIGWVKVGVLGYGVEIGFFQKLVYYGIILLIVQGFIMILFNIDLFILFFILKEKYFCLIFLFKVGLVFWLFILILFQFQEIFNCNYFVRFGDEYILEFLKFVIMECDLIIKGGKEVMLCEF